MSFVTLAAVLLIPVPLSAGSTTVSSELIPLVVGVPSVIIAVSSYFFATKAHREAVAEAKGKVDAEAYTRAKDLYESAISELRTQVAELRTESARQRERVTQLEQEAAARVQVRLAGLEHREPEGGVARDVEARLQDLERHENRFPGSRE